MLSFDIVSLHTSMSVNDSLVLIGWLVHDNTYLNSRTSFGVNSDMGGVNLCLRSTYFMFQGTVYKQVEGVPMESPSFPIVVNVHTKHVEEVISATFTNLLRTWWIYVGDMFVVINSTFWIHF